MAAEYILIGIHENNAIVAICRTIEKSAPEVDGNATPNVVHVDTVCHRSGDGTFESK